jgi:hypothetical protein
MTPEKSIYDLARVVFAGNSVMLKEHFRCVPAIIEFSNREFYDGDIKPLRLPYANERLDTLMHHLEVRSIAAASKNIRTGILPARTNESALNMDDPLFFLCLDANADQIICIGSVWQHSHLSGNAVSAAQRLPAV